MKRDDLDRTNITNRQISKSKCAHLHANPHFLPLLSASFKRLFSLSLLLISYLSNGQDKAPIVTDRPTQTPASAIMPVGKFLIETGFIREFTNSQLDTYTLPNVLIRYGVNEYFEVRLQQDYLFADLPEGDESGFNSAKIGFKIKLANEIGWLPQMSFLGNITTTTGQDPFKNDVISSDFSLVFSNTLLRKFSLGYSIGLINGEFGFDTSLYTLVLGYPISDKLSAYVEPYGFGVFDSGANDLRFNSGLVYLAKDHLQFDASMGAGLSAIAPNYFIGLGAAVGF
ncbi:MAG: transporter [Bacteroidota bacterium]